MKRISNFGLMFLAIGLTACGLVQRHSSSGYSEYDTTHYERDYDDGRASSSKSISGAEREVFEVRQKLKRLEASIETDTERKKYFRIKPFFQNDKERIDYLSLKDTRARERFAQSLGYSDSSHSMDRYISNVVEQGDIAVGMPKGAVEASWGKPIQREVAGNSDYENERWIYTEQITTNDGFKDETRVIYFENGLVTGWETSNH